MKLIVVSVLMDAWTVRICCIDAIMELDVWQRNPDSRDDNYHL